MKKKTVFIIITVLLISILSLLISSYLINSPNSEFINELRLKNSSDRTICATIDLQTHKSRFGIIHYKSGANEGFLPNYGQLRKLSVYWSFEEDNPYFYYYKVEFKIAAIKLPEDIYKIEFVYIGGDDWKLNLYSKKNPITTFSEKSTVLETPIPDTE